MPIIRNLINLILYPNIIGRSAIILSISLIGFSGFLGMKEISCVYPGPAKAALGLAIVIFIISLVINNLSKGVDNLQAQKKQLSQQVNILKAQNSTLEQTLKSLKETPNPLPRISGIELLVERWKSFKPTKSDKEILIEQFAILQSIAQSHYHQFDEIILIKYFAGTKIKSGAFLFRAGSKNPPFVLKFDSEANVKKEKERYKYCVQQLLRFTPGEPFVLNYALGCIQGHPWGAIAYHFVGPEGAEQPDSKQLQSFGEYYMEESDNDKIENVLSKVIKDLEPWWDEDRQWPPNCGARVRFLYSEYDRLTRNYKKIEDGIRMVGKEIGIESLENIKSSQKNISFDGHTFYNPLYWIKEIFQKEQLGEWAKEVGYQSIVHGDFHAGNILISKNDKGDFVRPWIIDFPHTHIGPTVQDIARLEADIKFGLFPTKFLTDKQVFDAVTFENQILGDHNRQSLDLSEKPPSLNLSEIIKPELTKAWRAITVLRRPIREKYLKTRDARPYHLALLHATLPMLYYRDRSPWQKLYAFISAALLCERLEEP